MLLINERSGEFKINHLLHELVLFVYHIVSILRKELAHAGSGKINNIGILTHWHIFAMAKDYL